MAFGSVFWKLLLQSYYSFYQVTEGEGSEYILDDDESPLAILMSQPNDRGEFTNFCS